MATWKRNRRPRRWADRHESEGDSQGEYDPFDSRQSPNLQPIDPLDIPTREEMMARIAGGGGEGGEGEGGAQGGGASQPLDLSQLVMMLSMRMGMSRVSDELIYTLFFAILGTSVTEKPLYERTMRLPDRMSLSEARTRLRRENRGSPFAYILSLTDELGEKAQEYVDRDYFARLVNLNIPILRDLKQQGILNWGQMMGQGGMGLMPMENECLQLTSYLNPKYRQFVTTGEV